MSINPAPLTVSGSSAANKVYDGNTSATLSGGSLSGVYAGDAVILDQAGRFATRSVGTGIAVTAADSLDGPAAGNYILTQPTGLTASITPAALLISGITAANKTYDGTTAATINTSGASYIGLISGDAVSVSASGMFSDRNVGTAKPVTLSSSYTGADAGNYSITSQTSTTASITPATLTYVATPASTYNGQTPGGLSGTVAGLVAGDTLGSTTTGALLWSTPAASGSPPDNTPSSAAGSRSPAATTFPWCRRRPTRPP